MPAFYTRDLLLTIPFYTQTDTPSFPETLYLDRMKLW